MTVKKHYKKGGTIWTLLVVNNFVAELKTLFPLSENIILDTE